MYMYTYIYIHIHVVYVHTYWDMHNKVYSYVYIYICIYIYRYIHTCIALHYVTLRYVALHCISLPYVVLHYIHTYIHSFITKTYKHMWLQVDWNTYTMLYTYLYTSANAWQCNMGDVTGFQTKVATAYNSNSNNSNNNTNTNTTNDNSGAVVTITTATMTMTTSTATTTTTGTTSTKKKKNKKKKKKNNKKKKRKHKQKQSWINWIKRFPTQNQKTFCPSAGQSCGDDWKLTSESVSMLQFVQHCSIYGSQNCPCFPEDKAKLCCLCWFRSTFWLVFLSALSIPNNYVFLRTTWLWAKIGYPNNQMINAEDRPKSVVPHSVPKQKLGNLFGSNLLHFCREPDGLLHLLVCEKNPTSATQSYWFQTCWPHT